ncbi:uncharacterized protein K444DRAFT_265572 [Hyaloscypha bicolor E]|uniref:Secreted protein n=1 Tax=Hyaloscypha bicolor E TaxID=1095630 RepID=A0A2J6SHS9_9HELO|nr:uncharacterized protein K444DRAFT_265572 [Hyaloscypha bicolor E]PMD50319.1 hypothetical protein K444DRAFT_265572 [Hyaloscypha bicolor E]
MQRSFLLNIVASGRLSSFVLCVTSRAEEPHRVTCNNDFNLIPSYLHVLNHPFAHSRFQKSLKPSWFCVVAQHHVLQFPLSAKTCSIRTAGTSTVRCMISRLSCSVRSTGARSKSHEARVTRRPAVHRYVPQAATGLDLVATRSVRSGGRILTVVLPCATLEAKKRGQQARCLSRTVMHQWLFWGWEDTFFYRMCI